MFRWILRTALAAVVTLLVGCGDDDGERDALSEADYLAEVNAIGREHHEGVLAASGETAGEIKDQIATLIDVPHQRLRGLTPPANLQDEHDALVKAIEDYDEVFTSATEDIDEAHIEDGSTSPFWSIFDQEDMIAAYDEVDVAISALVSPNPDWGWIRRR